MYSGCDFFLNRRIKISKLAASFPRIAPVRLFRRSIHDFFGLNTEPMNRAVGGSHLYPVRHAKKAEQNALFGHKKYTQPNSRIETCRRFDYFENIMLAGTQYFIFAGTKRDRTHMPIVISERFVENECAG